MNCLKWMLIGAMTCLVVGTLWWCGGKYGRCMWLGDVIFAGVAVGIVTLMAGILWAVVRIGRELKRIGDILENKKRMASNDCVDGETTSLRGE